ncbi:O-antigen ligase family protein [Dankookia sp. GCM10030260]|uniref:O-antigen ligase family protein n=1 Tax=Dankookia sp. GCM10030260 TaxID=3273390 RepID=UPI0036207D8F
MAAPGKADRRSAAAYPDLSWPVWGLTFVSLTCFNLSVAFGAVLVVAFLACWMLYLLAWPARSLDWMLRTPLVWVLPILALVSVLWSQAPSNTLRIALQLLAVTGFGILIARAQPLRSFVGAFMCVMLVSVLVGTVLGRSSKIGLTNETALIGIFGSKNNFAMMISLMLLAAIAVVPDSRQPGLLRLVGVACCLLAPPYMVLTKSVGAMATLGGALGVFGFIALAANLPARVRPAFYLGSGLLALVATGMVLVLLSSGILEQLLNSIGKDTTLTGRTALWQRAEQLIALKPILGVGYQAFWVQESVEAEGLWRMSKVAARFGFHMHNLYYETAIELGYVGVAVFGTVLATLALCVLVNACRRPSLELAFIASVVAIFGLRASVELDFIAPYALGTLLIPIVWIYGTRQVAAAPQRAIPPTRAASGVHPLAAE